MKNWGIEQFSDLPQGTQVSGRIRLGCEAQPSLSGVRQTQTTAVFSEACGACDIKMEHSQLSTRMMGASGTDETSHLWNGTKVELNHFQTCFPQFSGSKANLPCPKCVSLLNNMEIYVVIDTDIF